MIDTKVYELVDESRCKTLHSGKAIHIVIMPDVCVIKINKFGEYEDYPSIYKKKVITSYQIKYASKFNVIYVVL